MNSNTNVLEYCHNSAIYFRFKEDVFVTQLFFAGFGNLTWSPPPTIQWASLTFLSTQHSRYAVLTHSGQVFSHSFIFMPPLSVLCLHVQLTPYGCIYLLPMRFPLSLNSSEELNFRYYESLVL